MNKARVEAVSDGIFAIVMTLLIFNVKVSILPGTVSNAQVWDMLGTLWPLLVSYAFSFLLLAGFWISHHFIFHSFARSVNRSLNLLNMVYLMFLAFVPFSAQLVGAYPHNEPAVLLYGINMLAIVSLSAFMVRYVRGHHELVNEHLSQRLIARSRIRGLISVWSYALGIAVSFVFIPATILFYAIPITVNLIPGTLTVAERAFGFHFE